MGTIIIEALAKQLDARVEVVRNPDRDDNRIWFVTDLHSGKEQARNADDPSHPSLMGAIMSIGVASGELHSAGHIRARAP
jgi:hypothetical protein